MMGKAPDRPDGQLVGEKRFPRESTLIWKTSHIDEGRRGQAEVECSTHPFLIREIFETLKATVLDGTTKIRGRLARCGLLRAIPIGIRCP